jgi:hypothetical protein
MSTGLPSNCNLRVGPWHTGTPWKGAKQDVLMHQHPCILVSLNLFGNSSATAVASRGTTRAQSAAG